MYCCCSAFKDIKGKGEDTYSYNPCYPFNEDECKNVAVSIMYVYTSTVMYEIHT